MSIKFNEIENKRKNQKSIQLVGKIEDKVSHLLIKLNNNIYIQADKYSEIGINAEEAVRMSMSELMISNLKTFIITEDFMVVEILIEE